VSTRAHDASLAPSPCACHTRAFGTGFDHPMPSATARLLALTLAVLPACGDASSSGGDGTSGDGGTGSGGRGDAAVIVLDAGQLGSGGDASRGDASASCGLGIPATVRDFKPSTQGGHPDFERYSGSQAFLGLVNVDLGADQKPVYAAAGPTSVSTGPAEFAQWYNDVPGVNQAFDVSLVLTETPPGSNVFTYTNPAFFPIDGRGFGNGPPLGDGTSPHNFAFTTEVHLSFTYAGGELFTFRGDDDLWVFINRKLAIDLGGLHPELEGSVSLDARATALGIEKGKSYAMDIFHAERHTDASHFNITTTIKCFAPVGPR
jgi:fibro-slime domain-containing protein